MPGSAERLPEERFLRTPAATVSSPALLPDDAAECFRAAFEDAAVGMAITGLDRRFIYVNRALATMTGRTQEELRGLSYEVITHPDDVATNVGLSVGAVAGAGDTYRMEKRYLHADGSVVWADLSSTMIRNADGSPRYFVAHMLDQSARRAQQEELEHRDRVLDAVNLAAAVLFEQSIADGLAEVLRIFGEAAGVHRSYLFEHIEQGGSRLTRERAEWNAPGIAPRAGNTGSHGYRLADVGLGRWERVFAASGSIAAHVRDLPTDEQPVLASQGIASILCVPVMVDDVAVGFLGFDVCGSERAFAPAEIDALEIAARVLAAAVKRERTEAALAESRRLCAEARRLEVIGRIASGVAHDFNNLLTVIGSYGDLLAESVSPDDREIVDEIRGAVDRATSLSRQLLDASRPQDQRPQALDLNQVVRDMAWVLGRVAGDGILIETDLSHTPVVIEAPTGDVQQVLLDLVVEARDASDGDAVIRIATSMRELDRTGARVAGLLPGAYGALAVTGSRLGPDPAGARPDDQAGSHEAGVGLSIARGLAVAAGGSLDVVCEPGGGATATVLFRSGTPFPAGG